MIEKDLSNMKEKYSDDVEDIRKNNEEMQKKLIYKDAKQKH